MTNATYHSWYVAACNFTMTKWLHLLSINLQTEECAKCGMSLGLNLVSGSWRKYGYKTGLRYLLLSSVSISVSILMFASCPYLSG